jgi:hypothetical protein
MKRIILTIVTVFCLTIGIKAQTEQEQMITIDKQKTEIKNAINTYRKVVRFKDSLSYKYVYLKNKDLQMVNIWVKTDSLNKDVEWYFVNGKLVYSEQIWKSIKTNKVVDHKQFYLNDDKLFVGIGTNGKRIDPASKEFKEAMEGLAKYAEHLRDEASHL